MSCEFTPQSRCRFGIARADITPPVGIYHRMWGAAEHDRSEGVHRPLTATVLYFSDAAHDVSDVAGYQVLIALDHCLLGVDEVDLLLNRAAERSGLSRQAMVITFSHTHAAGLLNYDRQSLPGGELIPAYLEQLADTVANLVVSAAETAVPANIVYGAGRCNLAANRDYFDRSINAYVCGYNPEAAADDLVQIARVTDHEGALLGTIVNYACHPTTLAWDNRLISPDFPGAMRELVEHETGATCVFLQGASGELGPVEGFVGDTVVADRNGRQLAHAALSVWESLPPPDTRFEYAGKVVSGAAIGTWRRVPHDTARAAEVARWGCEREPVTLAYRPDRPGQQQLEDERSALLAKESQTRQRGDLAAANELRALAERKARMLERQKGLPDGERFPLQAHTWRIGDAIWVAVMGEPYSLLQRQLRERFPQTPIVVSTIVNGWGPSYLPPREAYDRGIYQETIAALAAGSLETLIDALTRRITGLMQP